MNRPWLYTLGAMALMAAASATVFVLNQPKPLPPGLIYGNGHLEGTEVRVISEVAGKIVADHLVEGQHVAAGDLLVVVDDAELRDRLEAARAKLRALEQRIAGAAARHAVWSHHLEVAERNYQRFARLGEEGTAPFAQVDEAANRLAEAQGEKDGAAAEKTGLVAELEAEARGISVLEIEMGKTRITAPLAGWLELKAVEKGEVVRPGQVLAVIVELSPVELKVYLPGPEMGKIRLGDPARVRVDAFPDELFEAAVQRVDSYAQFTPRDVHLPDERVQMVYGVTLRVENPEQRLKTGMPADAWILWADGESWPERLQVPGG